MSAKLLPSRFSWAARNQNGGILSGSTLPEAEYYVSARNPKLVDMVSTLKINGYRETTSPVRGVRKFSK